MSAQSYSILGGGLSGLTAAYKLSTAFPKSQVTLIESSDRLGGWIRSTKHRVADGHAVVESGPRSIRPRGSVGAAAMLQLIRELDLEDQVIPISKTHPSAKNRFILSPNHQLRPLSLNPFKSAISPSTILSAAMEPLRRKRSSGTRDESVDSFLRRRAGDGVARLASAGLHGIYAASTEDLSARFVLGKLYEYEEEYGSVMMGLWKGKKSARAQIEAEEDRARWAALGQLGVDRDGWAMYGLHGGLETLTDRLAEACRQNGVDIKLGESVTALDPVDRGVEVSSSSPSSSLLTSRVISTIPPPALAKLVPSLGIPHGPRTSVGVVSLVLPLPPSAIHPEGFGYLIPRPNTPSQNPHGILGVVFDSTALPGLDTAQNVTKLTVMMGGPYWSSYKPVIARPASSDELVPLAMDHLRTVFAPLRAVEPVLVDAHLHVDCIPTPTPGHRDRTRELHHRVMDGPWRSKLSFAGNAWGGIGVNDAVFAAVDVVEGIQAGRPATGMERWA